MARARTIGNRYVDILRGKEEEPDEILVRKGVVPTTPKPASKPTQTVQGPQPSQVSGSAAERIRLIKQAQLAAKSGNMDEFRRLRAEITSQTSGGSSGSQSSRPTSGRSGPQQMVDNTESAADRARNFREADRSSQASSTGSGSSRFVGGRGGPQQMDDDVRSSVATTGGSTVPTTGQPVQPTGGTVATAGGGRLTPDEARRQLFEREGVRQGAQIAYDPVTGQAYYTGTAMPETPGGSGTGGSEGRTADPLGGLKDQVDRTVASLVNNPSNAAQNWRDALDGLLQGFDQAVQDTLRLFQQEGAEIDPATQSAIDEIRRQIEQERGRMTEFMAARGLGQSGLLLKEQNELTNTQIREQGAILSSRLSDLRNRLNQALMSLQQQRLNAVGQFTAGGLQAQQAEDAARRQLALQGLGMQLNVAGMQQQQRNFEQERQDANTANEFNRWAALTGITGELAPGAERFGLEAGAPTWQALQAQRAQEEADRQFQLASARFALEGRQLDEATRRSLYEDLTNGITALYDGLPLEAGLAQIDSARAAGVITEDYARAARDAMTRAYPNTTNGQLDRLLGMGSKQEAVDAINRDFGNLARRMGGVKPVSDLMSIVSDLPPEAWGAQPSLWSNLLRASGGAPGVRGPGSLPAGQVGSSLLR